MDCLFCQIVKREKKAYIIAENKELVAILDVFPVSDGHTLLISKRHFTNVSEVDKGSWEQILPLMKSVIKKINTTFQPIGFNVITNMNEIAYQSIFHFHIHIIPKYNKNKGFIWKSESQLNYSLPEVMEKLK